MRICSHRRVVIGGAIISCGACFALTSGNSGCLLICVAGCPGMSHAGVSRTIVGGLMVLLSGTPCRACAVRASPVIGVQGVLGPTGCRFAKPWLTVHRACLRNGAVDAGVVWRVCATNSVGNSIVSRWCLEICIPCSNAIIAWCVGTPRFRDTIL